MSWEFRIKPHDWRDVPVVECFYRGVFMATLVPGDGIDLRLYSKYIEPNAVEVTTDLNVRTIDNRFISMVDVPFETAEV